MKQNTRRIAIQNVSFMKFTEKAIMARELGAITHEESITLNTETVRYMNEHPRELNLC